VACCFAILNKLVAADFPPTTKITTTTMIINVKGIAR
jgi:hypothetical protein